MRRLTCPPGLPDQAYNAEKAGAKAIIVADYKNERLLTMAVPEDRPEIAKLKNDITIPTALITQEVGPGRSIQNPKNPKRRTDPRSPSSRTTSPSPPPSSRRRWAPGRST